MTLKKGAADNRVVLFGIADEGGETHLKQWRQLRTAPTGWTRVSTTARIITHIGEKA